MVDHSPLGRLHEALDALPRHAQAMDDAAAEHAHRHRRESHAERERRLREAADAGDAGPSHA